MIVVLGYFDGLDWHGARYADTYVSLREMIGMLGLWFGYENRPLECVTLETAYPIHRAKRKPKE